MPEAELVFLNWIQTNIRCGILDAVMPFISNLVKAGLIWIILAVILLCIKKYRMCGLSLGISLAAGALVSNVIIKNLVARPRPVWLNPEVDVIVKIPQDYSFPSGHTTASFAAAVVLMHYDKRLGVPALIFAVLVAFSRMYLYLHYPSDVIAGALIGTAVGIITVKIIKSKFQCE